MPPTFRRRSPQPRDRHRAPALVARATCAAAVAASLVTFATSTAEAAAPATTSAAAAECRLVVPARVVLRAVDESVAYPVGARWGDCPAWVRESGYHSSYDPASRAVSWVFGRVSGPPVANMFATSLELTSVQGKAPRINAFDRGDYYPLAPGTYRFDASLTTPSTSGITPFRSNLGGVALAASNTFVARYWSGVVVGATRAGQRTTIVVTGRRDGILTGGSDYVAPDYRRPASGARVQLRRDGRLLATLVLNRAGGARWSFLDAPGRHTYSVTMPGTPTNWTAYAWTRR